MIDLHDLNPRPKKEGSMDRFWECYVEGSDGGMHYKHFSAASAIKEAERLARLTGRKVFVFECWGICQIPVYWELPR